MNAKQDDVSGSTGADRHALDEIDLRLMERIQADGRLASGAGPGEKMDGLDFVRITGITRRLVSSAAETPASPPKPSTPEPPPLSFYEKGVLDVDPAMAPPGIESEHADPFPSETASALKEIVAELEMALAPDRVKPAEESAPAAEARSRDPETRLAEAVLLLQELEQQPMEPAPAATPQVGEEPPPA